LERATYAINQRRLERDQEIAPDGVKAPLDRLNEVGINTSKVPMDQRQDPQQVLAHFVALYATTDTLDDLLVRHPQNQEVANGAI
jgi:hypothetical protein